jgi:histidyl-tRNA synthetase
MSEFQRPRGTRDFGPEEMAKRRFVEGKMRETARLFGFGEVITPTFESTDLFIARSGEDIVKEMYAFQDKGGRNIALRPELTASVMRFYVNEMQSFPKPVKLFYYGNMFRYERPQAGRYREFFQFGAELIGAPSMEADAEVIALAMQSIKTLGMKDAVVRIGHLSILQSLFEDMGVPENQQVACRRLIDKADYDGLENLLSELGIEDAGTLVRIIKITGGKDAIAQARELTDAGSEGLDYLDNLLDRLGSYGFDNCTVDFGVARGLDYYTGMVFEIDAPSLGAEKQICGGGAYKLADLFGGQEVNSTGYAFGFDRVILALENSGVDVPRQTLNAYILPIGETARPYAIGIMMRLRKAGTSADMDLMGRNMKKAMKYANNIGAENVIIIGEKEMAEDSVTVRNMESGEQTLVPVSEIAQYLFG